MKNEIDLSRMAEFAEVMRSVRRTFPEMAREIDRCIFDAGQNHLGGCGEKNCECMQTFEQFHARQNLIHGTGEKADVV